MGSFVMALSVGLGALFVVHLGRERLSTRVLSATRNFYGTLKVYDYYRRRSPRTTITCSSTAPRRTACSSPSPRRP